MDIGRFAIEASTRLAKDDGGSTAERAQRWNEHFATAVRREALEEAARVCDELMAWGEYFAGAEACKGAIGALIDHPQK